MKLDFQPTIECNLIHLQIYEDPFAEIQQQVLTIIMPIRMRLHLKKKNRCYTLKKIFYKEVITYRKYQKWRANQNYRPRNQREATRRRSRNNFLKMQPLLIYFFLRAAPTLTILNALLDMQLLVITLQILLSQPNNKY